MLPIGRYEVAVLVSDRLRLDGGAMFGSVPKNLWQRVLPPDEENRIPLACRLLVLKGEHRFILVDCGTGAKWNEKERHIFAIEHTGQTLSSTSLTGVTDLILTHLHFDHAGGISWKNAEGKLLLSFPEANIYVSKENWDHARAPGVRERASYLPDNILPLEHAKLTLTADNQEIAPGITVHQVNGHTRGLQWILVRDRDMTIAYPSDLIPTSRHLPIPYVMGYDLHAEWSMTEKEKFLSAAVNEKWVVVFEHDPDVQAATIVKGLDGRYAIGEKITLPDISIQILGTP